MRMTRLARIGMVWGVTVTVGAAQELQLEPITVTAGKRQGELEDTALSMSAYDGDLLESRFAEGMRAVGELAPNLGFYSVGSRRTALLYMRGVGSSGPNQPAVGVFVDDVYYPKTGLSDVSLHAVERLEVLRGPQSTLYGRNTEGGAINIVTPFPAPEHGGQLSLAAGDYAMREMRMAFDGAANQPKTVFYGVSGHWLSRDGYTRNTLLNTDADAIDRLAGRMQLAWVPDDRFDLTFSLYGDRDRDGGYPLTTLKQMRANPYEVHHNVDASHERDMMVYDLQARYHAPGVDVLSITAFRDWENRDRYDQDFSVQDLYRLYDTDTLNGVSQEFRLISQRETPYAWLVGLYAYHNRETDDDYTRLGTDSVTPGLQQASLLKADTWGVAPFGRFTFNVTKRLHTMAGLRFEYQEKDADGRRVSTLGGRPVGPVSLFEAEQDYDEWMPEASISFDWTAEVMSYLRVARGFREGGFNNGTVAQESVYGPEQAWSYEIGVKSSWWDRRLRLDLTAFVMDIENQQLIQFAPGGFGFFFRNAGESRNTGGEVEIAAVPLEWLDIRAGAGVVQSEFESFRDPVLGVDYADNDTPFVPEYDYHASVSCDRDLGGIMNASLTIGLTGHGATYWDAANTVQTGGRTRYNASVALSRGRYTVTVFGRNLTDETYPSAIYAFPGTPPIAQPSAPQTVGVMLSSVW